MVRLGGGELKTDLDVSCGVVGGLEEEHVESRTVVVGGEIDAHSAVWCCGAPVCVYFTHSNESGARKGLYIKKTSPKVCKKRCKGDERF